MAPGPARGRGDDPRSADVWSELFEFNADVVLVGHDHTYERFERQDPDGNANLVNDIRQFVIGTGGARLYGFDTATANSEVHGAGAYRVAKLVLDEGSAVRNSCLCRATHSLIAVNRIACSSAGFYPTASCRGAGE